MGKTLTNTFPARVNLESHRPDLTVDLSLTIKTGFKCQQGDVLGEITADGLGRRRTKTLADGAGFATNSTVGAVEDASVFADGDVLKDSGGTTIGTIAANGVDTDTNQITITANAAVAVADGEAVLGSDGSEKAVVIANDGSDGVGDTPIDVISQSPTLDISKLRGLDDSAITELGGRKLPGNYLKF